MKKLILLTMIALSTMTYGQKFNVTPNGLRDLNDNEKTFVVINAEGKTAKQLYDNAFCLLTLKPTQKGERQRANLPPSGINFTLSQCFTIVTGQVLCLEIGRTDTGI